MLPLRRTPFQEKTAVVQWHTGGGEHSRVRSMNSYSNTTGQNEVIPPARFVPPSLLFVFPLIFRPAATATHLDVLLHADHVGLRHGEGVLQAVADDDHQGQALPVEVGSRRGLQTKR